MSHRITRQDLQISLDRVNEAFKAKWPNAAEICLVRYQGKGYQLYVRGVNHVATFPSGSYKTRTARDMESFLDGMIAGLSL